MSSVTPERRDGRPDEGSWQVGDGRAMGPQQAVRDRQARTGAGEPLERPWTPEELAAFLGVSPKTLRQWRCQGIGPAYYKLGREAQAKVRYDAASVREFLQRHRVEPCNAEAQS